MKGFYYILAWRPSLTCDRDAANKLSPTQGGSTQKLALISQAVLEKMFEHCEGRRRPPEYGCTISSPMSLRLR